MTAPTLLLGMDRGPTNALRQAIGADEMLTVPRLAEPAEAWSWDWRRDLEAWERRSTLASPFGRVVLCCWDNVGEATPFVEVPPTQWVKEVEQSIALWFVAARVATRLCADHGSMVLVVERPAALDGAGRSALTAVADGVLGLSRCLAASEGPRGVRVNAVATELWTAPEVLRGPAPPLPVFPGRVEDEVAGAVRLLLSGEAAGVTGSVTTPDGGRAT